MQKELQTTWDEKTEAYNSIFEFLESKGLAENDLTQFMQLFQEYEKRLIKTLPYFCQTPTKINVDISR
jgi:hypothetical protein